MPINPDKILKLQAKNIGPIIELDGELFDERQNILFARNGIGKSFIARSLRFLDTGLLEGIEESEIAEGLVSEEAIPRRGSFKLTVGSTDIGSVSVDAESGAARHTRGQDIFHVFTEDFVKENVRDRLDKLGDLGEKEIIIGGENAELADAKETKAKVQRDLKDGIDALTSLFEDAKGKHKTAFFINARLDAFKKLDVGKFFQPEEFVPDDDFEKYEVLLGQYEVFKSIPGELPTPTFPKFEDIGQYLPDLAKLLGEEISPASIAAEVREKIIGSPMFFKQGIALLENSPDHCPFCTQKLEDTALTAIDIYVRYFDDREAVARNEIERIRGMVNRDITAVKSFGARWGKATSDFNQMKNFFPSFSKEVVGDIGQEQELLEGFLEQIVRCCDQKLADLRSAVKIPDVNWIRGVSSIEEKQQRNASKAEALFKEFENQDKERKRIQNDSCYAFLVKLFYGNIAEIDRLRDLKRELDRLIAAILLLEQQHGEKAKARDLVARTFSTLIVSVFGTKYGFEADTFSLKLNDRRLRRGSDKTLSDGEKAVLAFCYYLAQIHMKVENVNDYKRVFLVIDDPVNSMSFDYIYSVAQILRQVRITSSGDVEFSLNSSAGRPRCLILTHNVYFFNVMSSGNVVNPNGQFELVVKNGVHKIRPQKKFVTPHIHHLRDVIEVAEGRSTPDHGTANSVRSVIEGVWKFVRPDLRDFGTFLEHLSTKCEIEVNSSLIHGFSHGGQFGEVPYVEQDLIDACVVAVKVVEHYAVGQKTAYAAE